MGVEEVSLTDRRRASNSRTDGGDCDCNSHSVTLSFHHHGRYAALAVSRSNGMLEFLGGSPVPLADIKNIRTFLSQKHPSKENELGIRPDILDNFVRRSVGRPPSVYRQ